MASLSVSLNCISKNCMCRLEEDTIGTASCASWLKEVQRLFVPINQSRLQDSDGETTRQCDEEATRFNVVSACSSIVCCLLEHSI